MQRNFVLTRGIIKVTRKQNCWPSMAHSYLSSMLYLKFANAKQVYIILAPSWTYRTFFFQDFVTFGPPYNTFNVDCFRGTRLSFTNSLGSSWDLPLSIVGVFTKTSWFANRIPTKEGWDRVYCFWLVLWLPLYWQQLMDVL